MGHIAGSSSGSTMELPLNIPPDSSFGSSLSYAYTRHEAHDIEVEGLTCEVNERGLEWWERLANFQMPWEWFKKGPQNRRKILNDVNFQVKSGQMLAVLGSSGRSLCLFSNPAPSLRNNAAHHKSAIRWY